MFMHDYMSYLRQLCDLGDLSVEIAQESSPTYEFTLTAQMKETDMPEIERVIFNDPATIVYWADGTKTVVKCQNGDTFSKETGLAMAIAKRAYGNNGYYNDVMKQWLDE